MIGNPYKKKEYSSIEASFSVKGYKSSITYYIFIINRYLSKKKATLAYS